MEKNTSDIRKIVRKAMLEMQDLSESDLLAKAGVDWSEVKAKLINTINNIINDIDTDDYQEADKMMGNAIGILKFYRAKIQKGRDMVNRVPQHWTLEELNAMLECNDSMNEENPL